MGWLSDRIKKNGIAVSERYSRSPVYFDLTPAGRTLIQSLGCVVPEAVHGRVLDAGAGRLSYQSLLEKHGDSVVYLDRYRSVDGLSLTGDLENLPFADGSFNTVFCSQVLEHVPEPEKVLVEFHRILKPGGKVLLTVPHLAYLHNEPHDYYRYTHYGLQHLFTKAGFVTEEVRWSGGVLSFLGHFPSTLLLNLAWGIPGLFHFLLALNILWSRLIGWLESEDRRPKRFALNLVVIAEKE
ncbi:MAG: Ubiquinone/menaquinone biosynthesis C-methyltransferase UbiE [Candidatus Hinthialibacteria bacterium OLB16]|nr:MAG: Ubiquinone/menaquinone biosynthesis C-methyltransferase UbiE [Candidatus Hinthialibacteria bacterium OLB16]